LKNLPIGIQDFEKLITTNYLYVDKTALMYNLATTGGYYFLSRPRRFGKSLFLSTLKAYFLGKKDLFKGLAVEKLEKNWTEYPILHLDLNTANYIDRDALVNRLSATLNLWEDKYGRDERDIDLGTRFEGIIRRAYEKTGQRVVILVDEYDKPMLQAIDNEELQNDYRMMLKGFYGVLKSMDSYIRFAFLTGVTKFSKVSIFSDLNNLNDISLSDDYNSICGINEEELHKFFQPYVEHLAQYQKMTVDEAYAELKKRYDGYHFSKKSCGMYNPFSVLNALYKKDFGSYWFETGTPTFLVKLLKEHNYNLERLANDELDADSLNAIDTIDSNPVPIIFQSGYLTIKSFDQRFMMYRLGFPNEEVKEGFVKYLMPYYTSVKNGKTAFQIMNFVREVELGRIDDFMARLKSFFADTPYELVKDLENHYQNVMYIVSTLCGLYTKAEYHTSEGRIDMTIETADYVYIFEFKFEKSAEEALKQIEEKCYAEPFAASGKKIFCIGVNFCSNIRNIDRYEVKEC
jgi:hypothetical protein